MLYWAEWGVWFVVCGLDNAHGFHDANHQMCLTQGRHCLTCILSWMSLGNQEQYQGMMMMGGGMYTQDARGSACPSGGVSMICHSEISWLHKVFGNIPWDGFHNNEHQVSLQSYWHSWKRTWIDQNLPHVDHDHKICMLCQCDHDRNIHHWSYHVRLWQGDLEIL